MNSYWKTFLFLVLILGIFSCRSSTNEPITDVSNYDSIQKLLLNGTQPNYSLHQRIQFTEQAYQIAKNSHIDSLINKSLRHKFNLAIKDSNFSETIQLAHTLIKRLKKDDLKNDLADFYFVFAGTFYMNNPDSAFYYYHQSKNEYINLNDHIGIGKNYINMAIIQSNEGDYFGSEKSAIDALTYLKNVNDSSYLFSTYNALAISSGMRKNYNEEQYWYTKAGDISNDEQQKIVLQSNRAVSYRDAKNYKQSLNLFNEIKDHPQIKKDPLFRARIIDNMAYTKWLQDPKENVLEDYLQALAIRKDIDSKRGMISSYLHLTEYYYLSDNSEATNYAKKMLEQAHHIKSPDDELIALELLIKLNQDKSVKDYAVNYIDLNDSLQSARALSVHQYAKIRFDSDKIREENQNLNLIKAEKELELERSNKRGIIAISLLGFIIVLAISYHYYMRNKREQDKRAIIYQTEVKIAQQLHDELANDLYSTLTLVEASKSTMDTITQQKLIQNIEHIYSQTRSISRQNNQVDVVNFATDLNLMLASYQNERTTILSKGLSPYNWVNLTDDKKIILYRVLQELMINMKKHSHSTFVILSFTEKNKGIEIVYKDNGIGLGEIKTKRKNGLVNVENRIYSIAGKLTFESEKGVKVSIFIPY